MHPLRAFLSWLVFFAPYLCVTSQSSTLCGSSPICYWCLYFVFLQIDPCSCTAPSAVRRGYHLAVPPLDSAPMRFPPLPSRRDSSSSPPFLMLGLGTRLPPSKKSTPLLPLVHGVNPVVPTPLPDRDASPPSHLQPCLHARQWCHVVPCSLHPCPSSSTPQPAGGSPTCLRTRIRNTTKKPSHIGTVTILAAAAAISGGMFVGQITNMKQQ